MGNMPTSETWLITASIEALRRRLPAGWSVRRTRQQPRGRLWQPDAVYEIAAPDGSRGQVAVEAKRQLYPRDVVSQRWLSGNRDQEAPVLLVTEYISLRTQEVLEEANLNFADSTGTLRLRLKRPALYIDVQGQTPARQEAPERRALQSLRTAAAARGVRALCDFRPPYGVRDFANRAGLSPATASRLFDFLDREALIERDSPGSLVKKVDWAGLLRRWAQDYRFESSNRIATFIEPRTLRALFAKLRAYEKQYAVTGSFAATRWASVAPPRLAAVYIEDVERASQELTLTPTETGINVLLAEPLDPVVFERTKRIEGVTYAAPSQVVGDLMSGPGRAPQEAQALLGWMAKNEPAWRN